MSLRSKSISRNMIVSLINQVVTLVAGLVVQRYILVAYGSTYNGLTSLVTQIMSYLVLLEAGLGAASTQALYKPLGEKDWKRASGIMSATAISYRNVGFMFSGLLVGGALLVPIIASGEVDFILAALLTLLTGGSYVFTYLVSGKYAAFLTADRKSYVRSLISTVTTIMSAVLRIIALNNGQDILFVQSIGLGCSILHGVVTILYVKRKYPLLNLREKPDFGAIGKRWNVFVHQIAGIVVNHTDILILSVVDTLKQVSVYSAYNMIYSHLGTFVQSTFMQAPQGDFGQLYNTDKKAFEKLYAFYETMFTVILFIIATLALLLTLPFIRLYTANVADVEYIDIWLPVLFVAIFIMNQVRASAIITVNAAGAFKETQWGAIVEAVINIVVSLSLFFFTDLGMKGLLLGTVASYLFRTVDVISYVYRKLIDRSIGRFLRLVFANVVALGVLVLVFYIWHPIEATSYFDWFVRAVVLGIITVFTYVVFNFLINFRDTRDMLARIINKFYKKRRIKGKEDNR